MRKFIPYLTISLCVILMTACNGSSPQKELFDYAIGNSIVTECQLLSFPEWDGKPKIANSEEVILQVQGQEAKVCFKDIPRIKEIPSGTDVHVINIISADAILVLACIPTDQIEAGKKDFSTIKGYFTTDEERIKEILESLDPK